MDWSYIAGYFDGEGCVMVRPAHGAKGAQRCELSWHNSDRESIEAMEAFMGCGRIVTRERPPHRTMYALMVSDVESIQRVVEELIPRCIIKREKLLALREALKEIKPRAAGWGALTEAGTAEIRRLYHDEGWTQQRIGERFGVTQSAVKNFMHRNGISTRPRSEAARQAQRNSPAWHERNRKISEARKREWAALTPKERRERARPMFEARHSK